MDRVSVPRGFHIAAFASALLLSAALVPSHASAQVAAAQTQELLPPGQNTCQQVTVTSVQPYIYDGFLESFDVTISNPNYVGLFSTVGNTQIPLNYITRWAGNPSGLLLHVDLPATPVGSGLPVSLTLMASAPGAPTCLSTVSFTVSGSGISAPVSTSSSEPQSGSAANSAGVTGQVSAPQSSEGQQAAGATSSQASSGEGSLVGASVAPALNVPVTKGICSGSNAYRLWFVLLALYVILTAVVVFAELSFFKRSVLLSSAAILVPLILLLVFWYFSAACRAASWIPVIACIIAIAGLFLTYREYETLPLLTASKTSPTLPKA